LDKLRFHLLFDNFFLKGHKYTPKLKLSAAAQERLGCLQVAGIFGFRSSLADHLDNIKIFAKSLLRGRYVSDVNLSLSDLIATFRVSLPMIFRYIRYNRMYNPTDLGVYLRVSAEQKMVRESGLYLRDEKDAFGIPMIDVDWKIDGSEVESIALFAEAVGAQLQATGLARLEIDPALEQRSAEFLSKIDDANHHMGMARMSETSETGVVDMNLRVQGCDNLFVAGAAVFPSTGFANPTFTAMALGVRLCDYLVENEIAQ
jgi:hypothetical protein